METNTNQKKSFFKSKMFIIPMVAIMLLAIVSAAAIYINTAHADVTVTEALTVTPVSFAIATMPGQTETETLTIHNAANVPLKANINWIESTNIPTNLLDDNLTYTNTVNQLGVVLAPGVDTPITLTWTVNTDSTIGTFDGNVIVTRVA